MTAEYNFKRGTRGSISPVAPGKTRITIRIDDDVLAWFRERVHASGGGNYQSLINQALREHIIRSKERLEDTLRRVIREESIEWRVPSRKKRAKDGRRSK